jgi:hypothetical protein
MKINYLEYMTRGRVAASLMVLTVSAAAVVGSAEAYNTDRPRLPAKFAGLLNDYTPPAPAVSGGPYEMHGIWMLRLSEDRTTATFTAEMTMQTGDFANTDPNHDPTKLGPHTHHLSIRDGVIHNDPTDPINWKTQCPIFKPAVTDGFVVTGTAFVTGNGGNPPFGNPSAVSICILGGTQNPTIGPPQAYVEFSNFTLAFAAGSLASVHFGAQAINGVVSECERPRSGRDAADCKVAIID